jgi:hypothetical protein
MVDWDGSDGAFRAMVRQRAEAVIVMGDAILYDQRRRITELARTHQIPSFHEAREYAEVMSNGQVLTKSAGGVGAQPLRNYKILLVRPAGSNLRPTDSKSKPDPPRNSRKYRRFQEQNGFCHVGSCEVKRSAVGSSWAQFRAQSLPRT